MAESTQSYKSHRQFVPAFHFFVVPVLIANVVVEGTRAYRYQALHDYWMLIVALALVILVFAVRGMALKAQDRVIRLEERQRLASLMPAEHQGKIKDLTPSQLIALRFASDEEAPGLAQRTMTGEFKNQNEIKQAVKNWRADTHRV